MPNVYLISYKIMLNVFKIQANVVSTPLKNGLLSGVKTYI